MFKKPFLKLAIINEKHLLTIITERGEKNKTPKLNSI